MALRIAQRFRPGHERRQGRAGGQRGGREVARRRAAGHAHGVMAELLQRLDQERQRPAGHWCGFACGHLLGKTRPAHRVDALLHPGQRLERLATDRREHHLGLRHLVLGQPGAGHVGRRQAQSDRLAAASDGGQERIGRAATQHEAGNAGRLFERLEQRVGRDRVHALGGVDHHHLAFAARRGALREAHRGAHCLDLDLLAGLGFRRFLVVSLVSPAPAERLAQGLGQQHQQVGVRMRLHEVAAGAGTARLFSSTLALAQPGLRQAQRQLELPGALRAVHQQRMAALRAQRVLQGLAEPGQRQLAVGAYHPRCSRWPTTCAHTCSRGSEASMRAKRCGDCWQRAS